MGSPFVLGGRFELSKRSAVWLEFRLGLGLVSGLLALRIGCFTSSWENYMR